MFLKISLLFVLISTTFPTLLTQAQDVKFNKLIDEYSMNYLEPAAHMALAKYYLRNGNPLIAFYMLEAARRGRFDPSTFDHAFKSMFLETQTPIDQSKTTASLLSNYQKRIEQLLEQDTEKAKSVIQEGITRFPSEGQLYFYFGVLLQRESKLQEAEEQFVKAAKLSPYSVHVQSWVGRFFYKVKKDNLKALDYYLNAYFLDPHAYETEFVESRIRKINWETAIERTKELKKKGISLVEITKDNNPTVVLQAIIQARVEWKPEYNTIMVELMGHDDEGVRWEATQALKDHIDRRFDPSLKLLLEDKDLRRRGLSAYIAAYLWRNESFPILKKMLEEKSQLLRYDAISALMIDGGSEGRNVALEHAHKETNHILKNMLKDSADAQKR
jgi:hypothetical protein